MEKGHLRCDANVSVRRAGQSEFGTRTELKNLNSFKAVRRALEFEISRQIEVLESGGVIEQETLLWDEDRRVAEPMRSKEESEDYRYFPEPDLKALVIDEGLLDEVSRAVPELPEARRNRLIVQYGIREYDAGVLTEAKALADYFEAVVARGGDGQASANWITTELLGVLGSGEIFEFVVTPSKLAELLGRVREGEMSGRMAKTVFEQMVATGEDSGTVIDRMGLRLITDRATLTGVIEEVLAEHPDQVTKYRDGKVQLFGFFVGQVMRATSGQADPRTVSELLNDMLEGQ